MNFKFSLICVLIFVLIFTSCSKKNETQVAEAIAAASYEKILDGDLSEFAGTWVNGQGTRRVLMTNGTFGNGTSASFRREENGSYTWGISFASGGGNGVELYPVGVDVNARPGQTDTTKVRILIITSGDSAYNPDEFYYREGEAPSAQANNHHTKILSGDFSDFAGVWVNAYTQNQLFANGVFVNSSTRSIDGITTGDFNENNGAYIWGLYDGERLGYEIGLYPAGVQIYLGQNLVVSDTSKDRILIFQFDGFPTNDDVFYHEGELLAQTAANIPADILDKINKRIASVENGDIAAFRATLAHPEDAGDYYYQLSLLNTFFGEIFNIDGIAFLEAISDGTDELQDFANKLFHETRPLRNRNIGLRIISIEDIPNEWVYRVTLTSNSNEELIHNFRYSSF